MKKPLLTSVKELEALKAFSSEDLSQIPKLITSNYEVKQVSLEEEFDTLRLDPSKLSVQLVDKKIISSKPVYKYDFKVTSDDASTPFEYEAGDSFGFYPELAKKQVSWLAERLNLDLEGNIEISSGDSSTLEKLVLDLFPHSFPLSNRVILPIKKVLGRLDFCGFPKKATLRALAECCEDEEQAKVLLFLSSRAGSEVYNHRLRTERMSIFSLLAALDSLNPSLGLLLTLLTPLQPRYYSCANWQGNGNSRNNFQIVFSASEPKGVCSSWLESMDPSTLTTIPIVKRSITTFRLPSDLQETTSIIMIAAGTGIAPFIGFLETIQGNHCSNNLYVWLIFGCREEEFIFKQELEAFQSSRVLSKLSLAFSRANDPERPKQYVQDIIKEESNLFCKLMIDSEAAALCYICGDELTMIKGVNDAISEVTNPELLMKWTREKKIIRDIWI